MNNPIRTTIVYAFISGVAVIPVAMIMSPYLSWPTAIRLALWADIAIYGVLLARWSGTSLLPMIFPCAVLLGAALWPAPISGFFILALGVFSWMRSGICFQTTPVRAILAEVLTMVGGASLLMLFYSHGYVAMALNICLFFLVQSLYFFWVPLHQRKEAGKPQTDRFEQAAEQITKLLNDV